MSTIRELKAELRKKIFEERQLIPVDEWLEKSAKITDQILHSEWYKNADFLHCFISMNERKEVNTQPLIKKMMEDGKQVATSITRFEDLQLEHSILKSMDDLKPNKWGVLEPKTIIPADIQKLDVILVPMAAADKKGNRLGYGKGFYDRFLSETSALKIGLIFDDFIMGEIPTEEFDIKMNMLISEKSIILVQQ